MEIKIGPARELYDIEGAAVPIRDVRLDPGYADERLVSLLGMWVVDWPTWQQIEAGRLFHLDPNLRGPTFGGTLTADRDVEIEAHFDLPLLAEIADPDAFVVGAKLRGATSTDALAQTESWFARYVKQEHPEIKGLKMGFKTSWAPS